MIASINSMFETINSILSKIIFFDLFFFTDTVNFPLILAMLFFSALFFTVKLGFINIRFFKHAIDLLFRKSVSSVNKNEEISSFRALMTSLSATVGLGNIAGVAIAISVGGPGATFWMIIVGFLGMSSKFMECTLAVMYRTKRPDGRFMGGPMVYLKKGLESIGLPKLGKFLSVFFCLCCLGSSFGGGTAFQVNQSFKALSLSIPVLAQYSWLYGIIMMSLVGVVIIGNIKRIASVTSKLVPFMCGFYVLMSAYILLISWDKLPGTIMLIIQEAFSMESAYGGFLGVLIVGIQRAAFSNEAGLGSAAIAHSVARVKHPIEEGTVTLLEPFIDTVVICTMTALVIIVTGVYNNPEYATIVQNQEGAALTLSAMGEVVFWFPYLLSVAIFLFAFSTIISWSYYGERCFVYLFGDKSTIIYKISTLCVVFLGAVATSRNIMNFGDLLLLSMGFPNLIGLFFLTHKVTKSLKEYQAKRKNT